MTSEQLQRARRVFETASSEHGPVRDDILKRECAGDAEMRALVEQMIEVDEDLHPLLDRPNGLRGSIGAFQAGDRIGDYRIVREVGAGGMGTVYQAELVSGPDVRYVAIKVVHWCSPEISRRFEQEQTILSGLRHPNIARLLEGGVTEGHRPYFVMDYVEGLPIHSYCERNGLSVANRIELFRQVCLAVAYLHQNLVIHRDLKPGNVLVTANGKVKLLDFGIAKLMQADDSLPAAKTVFGLMTPDYASPEQIRGGTTSTLTDVYSLGVLLYELLSGQRRFTAPANQLHETLRRICEEEPRKPSVVAERKSGRTGKRLRGELDNIVLKAMRKEPERRYASVDRLDEDLRRYQNQQPVLAQGDSLLYRGRKFIGRYRRGVAAVMTMLVLLAGGVVATSIEAAIARRERERAEVQTGKARAAMEAAEQQKAVANAQRGRANELRELAEQHSREADRERGKAERRLRELQRLADGAVRVYNTNNSDGNDASSVIAQNARDSLLALRREQALPLGMASILDRSAATRQSYELAGDPSWEIPAGWTAQETVAKEYRVGRDRAIVHGGKSSLFLRSLVPKPTGVLTVTQVFATTAFSNKRVRLKAFLRTEGVAGATVLWLARTAKAARISVSGTTSWKEYDLVTDVPEGGETMWIYIQLHGAGTVWADDFRFEAVSGSVPLSNRTEPENLGFTNGKKERDR